MDVFVESCKRQYRQSFTMLRQALELCPEGLWTERTESDPPFWQQAYHTLVITEGYASTGFEGVGDNDLLVRVLQPRDPQPGEPPWAPLVEGVGGLMKADYEPAGGTVTREEMVGYLGDVHERCDDALDRDAGLDPADPAANPYPWTGKTSFDKHIYNLRHLHHHLGRLNGLLRSRADVGNPWVTEPVEPPKS